MALVTADDVADALGRSDLSDAEAERAERLASQVQALLELDLNRVVEPRTVSEDYYQDWAGPPVPNYGPVTSTVLVTVGDATATVVPVASLAAWVVPGSRVRLTYQAGSDQAAQDAVRGVVLEAALAAFGVAEAVSSGSLLSYSVEGESVTYGPVSAAANADGLGRVPVANLRGLDRLRRLVAL